MLITSCEANVLGLGFSPVDYAMDYIPLSSMLGDWETSHYLSALCTMHCAHENKIWEDLHNDLNTFERKTQWNVIF